MQKVFNKFRARRSPFIWANLMKEKDFSWVFKNGLDFDRQKQ